MRKAMCSLQYSPTLLIYEKSMEMLWESIKAVVLCNKYSNYCYYYITTFINTYLIKKFFFSFKQKFKN